MYTCKFAHVHDRFSETAGIHWIPLQVETAQLENLTSSTAISSMGWLESDPHCSMWSLRLSLQGSGTLASSTLAGFHSFKS